MSKAIILNNVYKNYTLYNSFGHGYKFILNNLVTGKIFQSRHLHALRDISFSIEDGEAIGIIGRNGAGKSTLLGLMAGVIKPTAGTVVLNYPVFAMLELGSGFHPDLTGRENILLNGVLLGLRRAVVESKVKEIVAFSELEAFIDQPIRTYSSGMLARLGFSILVCLEPRILLLDEVFAVGDVHFQAKCRDAMEDLKKRKDVTLILVSHDMKSIQELCDRVIWIDEGIVRMQGKTDAVVKAFESAC